MIIVGVALLILGFIVKIPVLWTLGFLALVIGVVLAVFGYAGHQVGGRRHYY